MIEKWYLYLIVGLLMIGLGVNQFIKHKKFVESCTAEADAKIVNMRKKVERHEDRVVNKFIPTFEFTTSNGNVVRSETNVHSSSRMTFIVGDKMKVKYDPNNPESFRLSEGTDFPVLAALLLVIGAIVIVTAFVL